jgi:hypothetical protein
VQGRRSEFKTILEMLRKQQADKHYTPLTAMDNPDAVLNADAGILGAARLTGKNGVDNPGAFLLYQCTSHLILL